MQSVRYSKILVATKNQGKFHEFQEAFQALPIEFISLSKFSEFDVPNVEETAATFIENALIKARNAANFCKFPVLADDSGLIVPSLNGAPGIFSARFAGPHATDQANINKLLRNLKEKPKNERSAYFYCMLVLITHANDPVPLICHGKWVGSILESPQGHNGFGYDPVFYVPTHHCSAAELETAEKNRMSHRGQALNQLHQLLLQP